ncbi:MAG: hypothetical protein DCC55_10570 [Chloroflexi bacterium]|nr:MAG: hypothetical protein DCC55_10570 [Chloroflexota bacterium]
MQQIGSTTPQPEVPIACQPGAIDASRRAGHFALAERLFSEAVREQKETADGYAFRFDAGEYPSLVEYIASERLCCPFLRFRLDVSPGQGPIWLRLGGGQGVKEFLQHEFGRPQK